MPDKELPDDKEARVDWVIRAPTNKEMRRRYDIWAAKYDDDVGSVKDYLAPIEITKVAVETFAPESRILDAGAGTGLVGQALKDQGFETVIAADYSEQMLEIARSKGVYKEIHQCDFSKPTQLDANSFDALVTCGTTSQVPSASLREYARLVRPGGKILFASATDAWVDCGYAAVFSDLQAEGQIVLISKGDVFQMMPTTEPQFYCEILVIGVL